jgi:hypothetical protein
VIMQGRLQGKQAAVGAEIAEFATAA